VGHHPSTWLKSERKELSIIFSTDIAVSLVGFLQISPIQSHHREFGVILPVSVFPVHEFAEFVHVPVFPIGKAGKRLGAHFPARKFAKLFCELFFTPLYLRSSLKSI
jgi:hypothetical protein